MLRSVGVTAAGLVLVLAGLAKTGAVADPSLAAPGILRRPALVVALTVAEIGLGLAMAGVGGRVSAALGAALYAGFTVFGVRALRGRAGVDCGCFGTDAAPMTAGHFLTTAVLAIACAVGAAGGAPPIWRGFGDGPAAGVLLLAQAAVLGGLAVLALTALPALAAVRKELTA